jgi:translocation protein SEC62
VLYLKGISQRIIHDMCDVVIDKLNCYCFLVLTLFFTVRSVWSGEKLVNFLVEPKMGTKWPKKLPRFENRQDAIAVCKDLCTQQYLLRCEKRGKGELGMMRVRDFDESGYFTWLYEGNKTMRHLMTAGLVMGFLCCVCFPIWPSFLKVFVWYMSVSLLLFIFFLITSRAVLFLVVWVVGWELWVLPNLFDESLGFVDSFKPVISVESTKPGQLPYRLGVGLAVGSFCYWAVTQPSEFDGFVKGQGDFLKDLYAGTLLSDVSQEQKENIDKPKMQSLDDLLKSLDKDIEENIQPDDGLDDEDKLDSMLENLIEDEEDIDEEDEDLN